MTNPFKWRHYQGEIILTCVRWYLRYALNYGCISVWGQSMSLVPHNIEATAEDGGPNRQ